MIDLSLSCDLNCEPGEGRNCTLPTQLRNPLLMFGFARVCEVEAQGMRRMIMLVVMALMLAGPGVASAQLIDPTTGVMVDPTTDPADFAAVAAGQPGNIGMELAAQASAQAQAAAAQAEADAAQQASSM